MTDELKLNLEIDRANHAQRLLDDDLLKEAFAILEQAYIKTWRETYVSDKDNRERLFIAVNMVGQVRDHLRRVVETGKLAQRTINQLLEEQDRRQKVVNIRF